MALLAHGCSIFLLYGGRMAQHDAKTGSEGATRAVDPFRAINPYPSLLSLKSEFFFTARLVIRQTGEERSVCLYWASKTCLMEVMDTKKEVFHCFSAPFFQCGAFLSNFAHTHSSFLLSSSLRIRFDMSLLFLPSYPSFFTQSCAASLRACS